MDLKYRKNKPANYQPTYNIQNPYTQQPDFSHDPVSVPSLRLSEELWMRETSQPAAHSHRWLCQNLPTSCHPSCYFVHPHIPSCPSLSCLHFFLYLLVLRVGIGGNNSLSTQEQLKAQLRALWSEEQLLFAISESITVWNDNMGGRRASRAPSSWSYRRTIILFLPIQHIWHVCKTTINT